MNKFDIVKQILSSPVVNKTEFIINACENKKVLDLGCLRHYAKFADSPDWLHGQIRSVAKELIGIDYCKSEVTELNQRGYNILYGDVTKPIDLTDEFEVIVAGDLIEHLSNFEGFFENCKRLLTSGGSLLVTTPNPFYVGEFHFVSFKRSYLMNPEHTCWIDPFALNQLVSRFGFKIRELYFLNDSWKLGNLISETQQNSYDILEGKWLNDNYLRKVNRILLSKIFHPLYQVYLWLTFQHTKLVSYSDYLALVTKE